MNLTTAQQATLKTDANSQGSLTAAIAAGNWAPVVAFYNGPSAVAVWIPNVPVTTILAATNWTTFAAKTSLQQITYLAMTSQSFLDATNANYRNGFAAVFSGADLTALSNAAQRTGTRLEILLASSAGPPAVCGIDANGINLFGQQIAELDAQQAIAGTS